MTDTVLTKTRHHLITHADWLALAAAITIAVLSFLPRSTAAGVPVNDLVNHVIAYCVLTGLALVRRQTLKGAGLMLVLVIGFGGLIELVQPHFGRANDLSDFTANTTGTLVGASIATIAPTHGYSGDVTARCIAGWNWFSVVQTGHKTPKSPSNSRPVEHHSICG